MTSTISRAIGAGRSDDASTAAAMSYILVLPFVGVYLAICYFVSGATYRLMGGKAELFDMFLSFLGIWACAVPAGVLLYVSLAILRARGRAVMASIVLSASAVTNGILGPVFMYGLAGAPKLGLAGAALASLVGMLLAGASCLAYLVHIRFVEFSTTRASALATDVFSGSAYAIGTYCIQPIGRFLLLAIMGSFGNEILASMAILFVIDRFMLNVFVALSSALAPFVGQNWGKGCFGRVRGGMATILSWVMVIGTVAWLGLWLLAPKIAAIFSASPTVSEFVQVGLAIYPVHILISALVLICCAAFNATANAAFATTFVTLGQIITIPACVYFGGISQGYVGMLFGMVIGQATVAALCLVFVFRKIAKASEEGDAAAMGEKPISGRTLAGTTV